MFSFKMMADTANQELSSSILNVSLDIYRLSTDSDNLFMSPSSVFTVLAMIQTGAKGETLKQMTKALRLTETDSQKQLAMFKSFNSALMKGSRDVIRDIENQLFPTPPESQDVILTIANRLYPNAERELVEEYVKVVTECFHSDMKPLMFRNNPEGCRKEINDWVETATQHKIKDILPSESVTADTSMVVVNAIYFKGEWMDQFEVKGTRKEDFYGFGGVTKKVDMMRQRLDYAKYSHNADLKCKVLHLPYQGRDIAMVVILPDAVDGLPKLEAALNVQNLQKLVTESHNEIVDVFLPTFKMETSLDIQDTLQKMEMLDLFDSAKADLSGIGADLFVSKFFHKAYVAVDENGTEAAAATMWDSMYGCTFGEVMEFRADKPFMFLIWHYRVNVPLFMGRFVNA